MTFAGDIAARWQTRAGFRVVRRRSFRNNLRQLVGASRLRTAVAIVCSLFFVMGLFLVFLDGFFFLDRHRLVTGPLIELLFGLFFGSLLVMLIFSTSIILYGGLFRSEEASFLLVRPLPSEEIFAFKFQEALAFSSWGFLLLATPMLLAYGISSDAPWWYYLVGVPFFVFFALLPASIGSLLTLVVARILPRYPRRVVLGASGLLLAFLAYAGLRTWLATHQILNADAWVNAIFSQLRVTKLPFLPSQWMAKGLLSASFSQGLSDAIFYLFVLGSYSMMAYLVTAWAYKRSYRTAYDAVASLRAPTRRKSSVWLPRLVDRLFAGFSGPVRVLLVKDVRIFSRDPLQWLQIFIFSGLLVIYFANLSRVQLFASSPYWRSLLGFFNIAVTGLLLSAYTSRFIFPLMSLEGQKIWILGLAPIPRRTILWSKFAFSVGGALIVTCVLTAVSAVMLQLDSILVAVQVVSMVIICFGVSGIAVGLGARFPDLKETDPSRIASGFGGTLNLITSLVFIVFTVVTMALPCHLYAVGLEVEQGLASASDLDLKLSDSLSFDEFRWWLMGSVLLSTLTGIAATLIPMRIGIRAFVNREF